jgi:hypothetical protein
MAVIIEGEAELTRRLALLEKKMHRQVLTKAAKTCGALVKKDYQSRVPVLTGGMRDAVGVTVRRFKHKAGTGKFRTSSKGYKFEVQRIVAEDIGASVSITKKRLAAKASQSKRGKRSLPWDRKAGGIFFYPAQVELGTRSKQGTRSLTKALYMNGPELRDVYIGNLRALINAAGVT